MRTQKMTQSRENREAAKPLGRTAFSRWSSLTPEFQERVWANMSDDVRDFWARQEDDQVVSDILAMPGTKILAGISEEHIKKLRIERDNAVHRARIQAAIRGAISDSSTVDFHEISEDGVTSLAILATQAVLDLTCRLSVVGAEGEAPEPAQ